MPRNGSGVYSKPAGTTAVPNTVIDSAKYNSTVDDIVDDLNAARPITAGGTGSTSKGAATTALEALSYGASQPPPPLRWQILVLTVKLYMPPSLPITRLFQATITASFASLQQPHFPSLPLQRWAQTGTFSSRHLAAL